MHRKLFTLIVCGGLLAGLALRADAAERVFIYHYQPAPIIYEPAPDVVAYDRDDRYAGAYDLQGVVTDSEPFHMTVRIHDDFYPVALHQGTVIKPTGITLTPSMTVHIAGYWSGRTFIADRVVVLR